MKRLTEHNFEKTDNFHMKCSDHCCIEDFSCEDCKQFDDLVDRLGAIEDILGDDYDLDRLRDLVEADKDGQCIVLDQDTVLSMLAGASAIRQNNRLCLSTYLFDMKKKYGGPFQIDYIAAEENLRTIGYAALKGEKDG